MIRLVIVLLSLFVCQSFAGTLSYPYCPMNLYPTATKGYFHDFFMAQKAWCSTSALCSNCAASVKLLTSLQRCLDISTSTSASLSDFPDTDGLCINIAANVVVKSDIKFDKGDNCVIVGMNATVGNIVGGRGNDFVYAKNEARVGKVDLRDGNDILYTGYDVSVKGVDLGNGRDQVVVKSLATKPLSSFGTVNLGKGGDYLNAINATFTSINTGSGSDIVYLYDSVVQKTLNLGGSDDFAQFKNSTVTKLEGGSGDNVFAYFNASGVTSTIGGLDQDDSSDIVCVIRDP